MNYLLIMQYIKVKLREVVLAATIKVRGWLAKY